MLLLLSRFSHVRLLATPWTAAHQAPPSAHRIIQTASDVPLQEAGGIHSLVTTEPWPVLVYLLLSAVPGCCLGLRWTPLDAPGVLPQTPLDSPGRPWSAALGDTAFLCSPPLRLWVNVTKFFFASLICWLFRFHVFGHLILFRTGDPSYATVNKIFWIFDYREDRKEKNILYRLKENCKM